MVATVVSLSNRALLAIGARAQISSITEGSREANAIAVLFAPTYEALNRAAKWNCFRAQKTLSLLAAATGTPENPDGTTLPLPPTPWLYSYAYPSDCMAVRFIVPSSLASAAGIPQTSATVDSPIFLPNPGQIPYAVAAAVDPASNPIKVILTNQSGAQIVYSIDQPNPITWDSQFQAAFVASLGAYLVPALSLDLPLMQLCIRTAQAAIEQARASDGNEAVVSQDHLPDWIRARALGAGYLGWGYGANGIGYGGYVDMCWPGG